jgi:hypothetical protein
LENNETLEGPAGFIVKSFGTRLTFNHHNNNMKKYQVTIRFDATDEFMDLVPPHRTYINYLINKEVIDQYAVSMESQRVWITVNAKTKKEVEKILEKSPLFKFWDFEIDELFLLDGQHYRLPAVQPN